MYLRKSYIILAIVLSVYAGVLCVPTYALSDANVTLLPWEDIAQTFKENPSKYIEQIDELKKGTTATKAKTIKTCQ